MPLAAGDALGPYEIVARLGAGGMGEVWKARDIRLDRTVAIKVLSPQLAADPEFRERFDREAKTIAALNHPHICALYDVGEVAELRFLVMEYLDGDSLATRLEKGALPLESALRYGAEIADALARAHRAGVTHRDLKPGNIMITKSGTKLLDFGLAKLGPPLLGQGVSPAGRGSHDSALPTQHALTAQGTILGTIQYMAPEQLEGEEADSRTDLFAFGVVLYEMLTGKKTFTGKTQASLFSAILKDHPPAVSSVQPLMPQALDRVIAKCLAKDREDRWQSAKDLYDELKWIADSGAHPPAGIAASAAPGSPPAGSVAGASSPADLHRAMPRSARLAWAFGGFGLLAALLLAVPAISYFRAAPPDTPETRLQILTPATIDPTSIALSPDGRRLAFVASGEGGPRLWLRALDAVAPQPVPDTDGAGRPFWSPDSRSVGFYAAGKLKRLDIGSPPQIIADISGPRGASWNSDGTILFAPGTNAGLSRVAATGGEVTAVTRLQPGHSSHRFPIFLDDGRFLFFVQGSADAAGVYFGALGSDTVKRLVPADAAAVYLPSGYLLYVRQGALLARRFDQVRGELIGDPVTVADSVGVDSAFNAAALSTSATGIIALRAGSSARRQLTWFDRAGRMLGALGPPDEGSVLYPELSPDGRRVVVDRTVQTNRDVWVVDIGRAVPTRFTFDTAIDSLPIWSPDGARIVFRSNRKGPYDLYEVQATSAGAETPLLESAQTKFPNDWSPDGRFILYGTADPKSGGNQVWALALDAKTEPRSFPVVQTRFDSNYAQFSPDGRWVAYQSNESGRIEIYVQPFVAPTSSGSARAPSGKWQMSTAGGTWPRWRADGREIFYIALDGKLMAVPVQARESTLEAGAPAVLFQTQIANPGSSAFKNQYDVSRDGRFLINMSADEATTSTITIIQNWKPR